MDTQYIDGFIGELLHINEVADNKLIDLNACGGTGTYFLSHTCADQSAYALATVGERLGKTGTTILLNSALAGGEQRVNRKLNTFEWRAAAGGSDVKSLHAGFYCGRAQRFNSPRQQSAVFKRGRAQMAGNRKGAGQGNA